MNETAKISPDSQKLIAATSQLKQHYIRYSICKPLSRFCWQSSAYFTTALHQKLVAHSHSWTFWKKRYSL